VSGLLCRKPLNDLSKDEDCDVVGDGQKKHSSILCMVTAPGNRMIKITFDHAEGSFNLPSLTKVDALP